MTLPVGITTCTATIGAGYTFLGEEAVISGTVVADRNVVWAATGAPIFKTESVVTPSSPGGQASFVVPHVDQDGFVDGAGNDITGWYYTFSGRATFEGNRVEAITKRFQVVVGQTTVDLDLVPDGPVIPGVTTPTAAVTSVNGETGAVTVAGGLDDSDIAALVADPGSDTAAALADSIAQGVTTGWRRITEPGTGLAYFDIIRTGGAVWIGQDSGLGFIDADESKFFPALVPSGFRPAYTRILRTPDYYIQVQPNGDTTIASVNGAILDDADISSASWPVLSTFPSMPYPADPHP